MKCSVRRILRVVVMWGMAVSAGYGSASLAAQPPLNPQDYPRLDDKQLGHIRHMLKLSSQPPGEWDGMGSSWFDTVERSLQYQLAFMTYALALAQYHYTPAYYDPYRSAIDADIQRILLPDIWQTWALASRGGSVVDPDQKQLKESALDPCAKDNIMLCGHVFQMAAITRCSIAHTSMISPGRCRLISIRAPGDSAGRCSRTIFTSLPATSCSSSRIAITPELRVSPTRFFPSATSTRYSRSWIMTICMEPTLPRT